MKRQPLKTTKTTTAKTTKGAVSKKQAVLLVWGKRLKKAVY